MSTLAEARQQVADALAAALGPDVPIYPAPPNNIAAPCAIVALGAAQEQPTARRWDAQLTALLLAPAGDNTAAVEWLEDALLTSAAQLADTLTVPVLWDEPGSITVAGITYLGARLRIPIDLQEV